MPFVSTNLLTLSMSVQRRQIMASPIVSSPMLIQVRWQARVVGFDHGDVEVSPVCLASNAWP